MLPKHYACVFGLFSKKQAKNSLGLNHKPSTSKKRVSDNDIFTACNLPNPRPPFLELLTVVQL